MNSPILSLRYCSPANLRCARQTSRWTPEQNQGSLRRGSCRKSSMYLLSRSMCQVFHLREFENKKALHDFRNSALQ